MLLKLQKRNVVTRCLEFPCLPKCMSATANSLVLYINQWIMASLHATEDFRFRFANNYIISVVLCHFSNK